MTDKPNEPVRKPKGAGLSVWRRFKLREIFFGTPVEPGKRRGTPQRKVRWGRQRQLDAAKAKRVRRDRAKRKMTKALQRNRRRKGLELRRG